MAVQVPELEPLQQAPLQAEQEQASEQADSHAVPVRIAYRRRVVLDVTVQIEALRIAVVRVGHCDGLGGPVGRHEPAEAAAIVAGTEHIEP